MNKYKVTLYTGGHYATPTTIFFPAYVPQEEMVERVKRIFNSSSMWIGTHIEESRNGRWEHLDTWKK